MKRLILMRHAKSSWATPGLSDHERPLNARGRRDAPRMGRWLAELGWVPELVISSDAQRTQQTWAGVAEGLDIDVPVQFTRELYHAGTGEIARVCLALEGAGPNPTPGCVMVLGHNPGWEEAVSDLTGISTTLTTGNCALLEADGEWASLMQRGAWRLVDVLRPREADG